MNGAAPARAATKWKKSQTPIPAAFAALVEGERPVYTPMPMRRNSLPWTTRGAAAALSLAVTIAGAPVQAAPAPAAMDADATAASAPTEASTRAPTETTRAPTEGEGATVEPTPTTTSPGEDTQESAESQPPPSTVAGMGSSVISSNNPEARRARADLEGTSLVTPQSGVPERMRPLQRAAWWTVFGTFALATTGGLFAGFAEVQEDRALRLASTLDPSTGSQYLYADRKAEYDDVLAKGERQQWIARGLLIGSGLTAIAAIAMFAVDARRQHKVRPSAQRPGLRLGRAGVEVRF